MAGPRSRLDAIIAKIADEITHVPVELAGGSLGGGEAEVPLPPFWALTVETFHTYLDMLLDPDPAAARGMASTIADALVLLRENSGVEQGYDPVDEIRDLIDGWQEPAAEIFRTDLPVLDNALRYQEEFARALQDTITMHAEVLDAARDSVNDILSQAEVALELYDQQQQREEAERLKNAATGLLETLLAYGAEGPAGAAAVALKNVGNAFIAKATAVTGDTPQDILRSMGEAFNELIEAVRDEERAIQDALAELDGFLSGPRNASLLPREIDPAYGVEAPRPYPERRGMPR